MLIGGNEVLAVVGGAPGVEQSSSGCSGELADMCIGRGGVTPTDLWARKMQVVMPESEGSRKGSKSVSPDKKKRAASSQASSPEKRRPSGDAVYEQEPFHRTVLAFPPRPRSGFSMTSLDSNPPSFLLFGGHTGQSGKHGHCLADTHLLEFVGSKDGGLTPSCSSSSSGSDSEDIFFASDYKVVLKERAACSMKIPNASRSLSKSVQSDDDSDHSSRCSGSESEGEFARGTRAQAFEKTLRETVMRLGSSSKVKMSRKKTASPSKPRAAGDRNPIAESTARWRLPQHHAGNLPLPRVGHVAVLQTPCDDSIHRSILIHGGLDDGGLPLGDTHEVRILEDADQPLKVEWHCLDPGDRETGSDGPAPWEQEQSPRPRTCHSGVFWRGDSQRCLVIFGGLSLGLEGEPRPLGDTWTFLRPSSQGVLGGSWRRPVMKGGAPARRWGHSCCLAQSSHNTGGVMLLCGGMDANGRALSDCWSLYLEDMRWELVETMAAASPVRRPLGFMSSSEDVSASRCSQPELGRCTATWSFSLGAAVVWSRQGFWTCRLPDQQPCSVSPQRHRASGVEKKHRGDQKLGATDLQKQWWEEQRLKISADDAGHVPDGKVADYAGKVAFSGLPEVLPPPRSSRWPQNGSREFSSPGLLRVHSEPRLHDSWRPAASLVRGHGPHGSQSSLLEPKVTMHGQLLADVPQMEAGMQWHTKHTLAPL